MCGRFGFTLPTKQAMHLFGLTESVEVAPRKNIAPMTYVFAVLAKPRAPEDKTVIRVGRLLKWGLVPHWAKDPAMGNRMINARSETAADKPAFRSAFRKRRCLIPADVFYEWEKTEAGKEPHALGLASGEPMALAGLWEHWRSPADPEGHDLFTATILTTAANELVARIHDRMPVILPAQAYDAWLDPATPAEALHGLLKPYPARAMTSTPVSKAVNNPANQDF